jgi:hypothetical protein
MDWDFTSWPLSSSDIILALVARPFFLKIYLKPAYLPHSFPLFIVKGNPVSGSSNRKVYEQVLKDL